MKMDWEGKMEDIDGKTGLMKEESLPVKLGLGVGAAAHSAAINHPLIASENNNKSLFTEAQKRELQHQAFVFKYIANGLPVPLHLVLPILKSVTDTFASDLDGFYKQYPSFVRFHHMGFDYGKVVDPEPYRCRRTDGKKWRCSKNVVPDQKYCESHMHRGRNRSRKPVETSEASSSSVITKLPAKLHAKQGSNTEFEVANPLGTQLSDTSTSSSGFCRVNTWSTSRCKLICSADTQTSLPRATVASPSSSPGTAGNATATTISRTTTSITSKSKSNLINYKTDDKAESSLSYNGISVKSNGKGNINNDTNNICTRIGFSPRSVLQGIIVSGCNHSCLNDRNSTELEPGRCRRTDGKKWRCRSAVLPNQKYCATHMHRGAKKRFADSEPAPSSAGTVTIARLPPSTASNYIQKAYCTIPNTNLSMSIPASAPLVQRNERSHSSSDTDTTITDTINENSYVSY
ncbi:hypothetical protein L6164_003747 [Bauhinia variegata]|uniref:Uncharacterized protein n=1 Tax=Bauhinia variegata TaxID=167791 RepID=A0ACB9Q3R8_BAUVA|nr:hypothetical protein L6164_003747 [Bauhinia variegata]